MCVNMYIDMCKDMYRHAKAMHMDMVIAVCGHRSVHRHVHLCLQTSLVDMHMCTGIEIRQTCVCVYAQMCLWTDIDTLVDMRVYIPGKSFFMRVASTCCAPCCRGVGPAALSLIHNLRKFRLSCEHAQNEMA